MSDTFHVDLKLRSVDQAISDHYEEYPEADSELDARLQTPRDEVQFSLEIEQIALLIWEREEEDEKFKRILGKIQQRRQANLKAIEDWRAVLLHRLEFSGLDKVKGMLKTVSLCQPSRPTIRWMRTTDDLPAEFQRVKVEVNLEAAHKVRDQGIPLPDGFDVTWNKSIRIR